MKPISPVVAGFEKFERIYGADQPVLVHVEPPRVEGVSDAEPGLRRGARSVGSHQGHPETSVEEKDTPSIPEFPANEYTKGTSLAEKRILRPATGDVLRFGRRGQTRGTKSN